MESWAIETTGLTKIFRPPRSLRRPFRTPKSVTAVDSVDLQVHRGELFGLLGPNGAGKTTLIKTLCTLIVPTAGTAQVMGYNLDQDETIKRAVGLVVSDERSFYWRLSAQQNLEFFATMVGLDGPLGRQRIVEVLEAVELSGVADRRFGSFSTGMRQRLAIARGLLHRPQLLFMDEPTRSLDPSAAGRLHTLIRGLVEQGVTVFLTTHNLSEAQTLCHRIAVMHRGRIRACATPELLQRELPVAGGERYRLILGGWQPSMKNELKPLVSNLLAEAIDGGRWELSFQLHANQSALTVILDSLRAANLDILRIHSELPSLEEVFTHYTQEEDH